jgi:hypothetical protein
MPRNRKQPSRPKTPRQQNLGQGHETARFVPANALNIQREVDYIVQRAIEHDVCLVGLGVLTFFSTQSGDAWMLDTEDNFAICLAIEGERQPARIIETNTQFAIEWDHDYAMEGDVFATRVKKTGQVTTVHGYPVQAILAHIQRLRAAQG